MLALFLCQHGDFVKKILPFFVLVSSFCFSEQEFKPRPFWEQDEHFQKYNCLMIEASIYRLSEF